jgi:hypothetical protein
MKFKQIKIALILTLATSSPAVFAADSTNHASKGVGHSATGGSELLKGSVKVAASVVAVPLISVGTAGGVSMEAGSSLSEFALGIGEPLPIADEVIVAGPPPKAALAQKEKKQ